MLKDIVQYPFDAQSDSFFCALSSALLPALGYTENTPYFCAPKGQFCLQCGACGDRTCLLYTSYPAQTMVVCAPLSMRTLRVR